ncbi:SDR family NAD(P)-dependent oxidoreductase [Cryptosporangium sp. NPDC051539]|uniref:SDR family NAD(P)-dependent oxidoreductase n=1 Tax=Cryptosporangium sp. NPDC051539 TaxID=3363962 RepID=UPI00378FD251
MSKTIVITGASDGIGAAAARQLHRNGHQVVVVGRSPQKTRAVADALGADSFLADFTDLGQVRSLAAALDAKYPRIDVLANNAGGVFGDRTKTVDGFEQTFQINHLAPFLLTRLLLEKLIASRATVIQTASVANRTSGKLDLDDLDHDRKYDTIRVYGAAKLENILFTKELHRRYHDRGISAVAIHPGNVASSFGRNSESRLMRFITTNPLTRAALLVAPEKGAEQIVWLSETTGWQPGGYYVKHKLSKAVNPQVNDTALAHGLWERSEELVRS